VFKIVSPFPFLIKKLIVTFYLAAFLYMMKMCFGHQLVMSHTQTHTHLLSNNKLKTPALFQAKLLYIKTRAMRSELAIKFVIKIQVRTIISQK
jgi:hypothetical protein